MSPRLTSAPVIRAWLLREVKRGAGKDLAARAAVHFGITRQAVGRHLRRLVDEDVLTASGATKSRTYLLALQQDFSKHYRIDNALQEHQVWSKDIQPLLERERKNVLQICEYGFTEILNNAIDHSASEDVFIKVRRTFVDIYIAIQDQGVGIFRKIRDGRQLESDRQAVLELTKGKVTTDPSRHTGEGIFFTSRMMDRFAILSDSLSLVHTENDWLFENPKSATRGTYVGMDIDPSSDRTMNDVFERYRVSQDDYAFARTHIVLALAEAEGGSLISRSQAKRVMVGLDRFKEVHLDFGGVPMIGPAFADEIFRVWQRAHQGTKLLSFDANDDVRRTIARAETSESEGQ
jgi:anti-sigma regulatory factor (Ser/Thr protein kinase)